MKKWIVLIVISACMLGCQAKKVYVGQTDDVSGAVISEENFLALPDAMIDGMADKTDFLATKVDPLDTADSIIEGLKPAEMAVPGGSLLLGIAGGVVTMLRKYRPIIEEGKKDGQALYEVVRGIVKAGNGNGVSSVTGESLATSLRASMSDSAKARVESLLTKLGRPRYCESWKRKRRIKRDR